MASGTVGYSDTRGNKDYLGIIANQIGKRIKQASDMAAEERAFAAKKAEEGGTSLEEAGVGKGYFFKRALGSRFGGDKIARTRGRFGAQGPGTDPSKNYKQRFRGGFDYNVTNTINQASQEVGGALSPVVRGVGDGLNNVSNAIVQLGVGLDSLAKSQDNLAKQTYFNGMILQVMVREINENQSRLSAQREERSLERRRLSGGGGGGGRRMINITPGGGGGRGFRGAADFGNAIQTAARALPGARKGIQATGKGIQAGGKFLASGATEATTNALTRNSDLLLRAIGNMYNVNPAYIDDLAEATTKGAISGGKMLSEGVTLFEGGAVRKGRTISDMKAGRSPSNKMETLQALERSYKDAPGTPLRNVDDAVKAAADIKAAGLASGINFTDAEILADLQRQGATPEMLKAIQKSTSKSAFRSGRLAKYIAKATGSQIGKSVLKKIPVIAGLAGIAFGIQRAMEGDLLGAGLEIASGLMGATGVMAGPSFAIDGFLLARDLGGFREGGTLTPEGTNVPFALGGGIGRMNEPGVKESVTIAPLKSEKQKGYEQAEGIADYNRRNKSAFVALHSQPVESALDRTISRKSWWDNVKGFFGLGDDDKKPTSDPEELARILGGGTTGTTGTTGVTPLTRVGRGQYGFGYNLPPTNTMSGQDYGDGRDDNRDGQIDRRHAGQDFDISGADEVFASQIGGVVTYIGNDPGGYGKYVDIVNKEKGVTERIAEGAEILPGIEIGATVTPGQPVVKGETNTGVIHYEIREGGNVDPSKYKPTFGFEGTKDPMTYLKDNASLENKVSGLTPTSEEMEWYKRTQQQSKETSQLNQDSSKVATAFSMPQIINNNTYVSQAAPIATSDDGNIGLAFQTLGLDAFSLEYSLANKA